MLLLLLALLQTAAPSEETRATLQSCETTEKGWVCHYQMPTAMTVKPLEGTPPAMAPPATVDLTPAAVPPTVPIKPIDTARQTRLIARCGEAKWYSACLPGERKEAQILKEAAAKAEALRGRVTTLLSERRCDDAVKAALEGGDLALARETQSFCAAGR